MNFKVHSFHERPVPTKAKTAKGTDVLAMMDGAEVELVPEDGEGKTITLLLHAENYAGKPAKEMFAVGNVVAVGFTLISAVAKPSDDGGKK